MKVIASMLIGICVVCVLAVSAGSAQTAVLEFGASLNCHLTAKSTSGEFGGSAYAKGADPKDYADATVTVTASENFTYSLQGAGLIRIENTKASSVHYVEFESKDDEVLATLKDEQQVVMVRARFASGAWSVDPAETEDPLAVHVFLANLFLQVSDTPAVTFAECLGSAVTTCGGAGKVKSVTYTAPNSCAFVCKD